MQPYSNGNLYTAIFLRQSLVISIFIRPSSHKQFYAAIFIQQSSHDHLRTAIFALPSSNDHLRTAIFVRPSSYGHIATTIFLRPSPYGHLHKFDMDLVASPRTSQSSQSSNSMHSPTIYVASNQSSQLEHSSYFSNPALMDDSNPPSLDLNTISLPTSTRGRRRRRETSPSPPLSPASYTPYQRPRTHTCAPHFLSTLTVAPPS